MGGVTVLVLVTALVWLAAPHARSVRGMVAGGRPELPALITQLSQPRPPRPPDRRTRAPNGLSFTDGAGCRPAGDWTSPRLDRRVRALLVTAAGQYRIRVSCLRSGHSWFVKGTRRVSNHSVWRGVDVDQVDGRPVSPTNAAARRLAVWIGQGRAGVQPSEVGSPWRLRRPALVHRPRPPGTSACRLPWPDPGRCPVIVPGLARVLGARGTIVLACLLVLAVCAYGVAQDLGLVDPPAKAAPPPRKPAAGCRPKPTRAAVVDAPRGYLRLYCQAGARYRVPWPMLAAIGKVESDHGRVRLPGVRSGSNWAGACGPMQIGCVPGSKAGNSWARYGRGRRPHDPAAAIPAAARYLVDHGARRDLDRALFAYNHSRTYVARVKQFARRYGGGRR